MKFFDTHCHLEKEMMENLINSETKLVTNIACDLVSSRESLQWTKDYDFVYGTIGLHPEFAEQISDDALEELKILSKETKIVAIGEIGLDYHWDTNPSKEKQRQCFEEQIELAKSLAMPIAIHTRDADQETLDILKDHKTFDNIPVLMHCFSGSAELGRQYIKLGAYLAIGGPVTYKNNRKGVEVVAASPLERLVLETDSPYLTPEPLRGHPNTPVYVKYTAAKIAEIKGESLELVAETTFQNAKKFYGIC